MRTKFNSLWSLLIIFNILLSPGCSNVSREGQATEKEHNRIQWWKDAKFGMFIHWGIYSVPAGNWNDQKTMGNSEWIMNSLEIPVQEYEKFASEFNPRGFNADEWVAYAEKTGAGYITVTAKHHDGFAMYDSRVNDYNIVKKTPFERDPIRELADACKKHGIKLCLYYSQDIDWHHPGGYGNTWDYNDSVFRQNVDRYYEEKCLPQIRELCTNYGEIGVFWFDTPRSITREWSEKIYNLVKELQPGCIMNSRLGNEMGDYLIAGERGFPNWKVEEQPWEVCQTICKSWGYNANLEDKQYWIPDSTLLRNLILTTSLGGNYLLNIGPDRNGEFPQKAKEVFDYIGNWMTANRESITGAGPTPFNMVYDWGTSTTKGNLLYLHLFEQPEDNLLRITGIMNTVKTAYLLGDADEKNLNLTQDQDETNALYLTNISIPSTESLSSQTNSSKSLSTASLLANPVLVLELDAPPLIDTTISQYPGNDVFTVGGNLIRGPKENSLVRVRFTAAGTYTLSFHSLLNFWGRGENWTGGLQEGKLLFADQEIPFALKIDSVYQNPWYSYSPIVISEIGNINVPEPGIHEIGFSGIEFYRGYNTGPNHHKTGLKLHFIKLIKNDE